MNFRPLKRPHGPLLLILAVLAITASLGLTGRTKHTKTIRLCDSQSSITIENFNGPLPAAKARKVARALMQQYEARKAAEARKQPDPHTRRERMIWDRELKKMVDEGYRLFHDWKALGGTIGVSCDMCHPNASNTHPQTYPKFQKQLKRVGLLRDMINWCLENTMEAPPLPENDPRMKALEAYIHWANRGTKFEPGRH